MAHQPTHYLFISEVASGLTSHTFNLAQCPVNWSCVRTCRLTTEHCVLPSPRPCATFSMHFTDTCVIDLAMSWWRHSESPLQAVGCSRCAHLAAAWTQLGRPRWLSAQEVRGWGTQTCSLTPRATPPAATAGSEPGPASSPEQPWGGRPLQAREDGHSQWPHGAPRTRWTPPQTL